MKLLPLKTLLSFSFALFIVCSSCKKEDESLTNPLVGSWVLFETEASGTDVRESTTTFVFNKNMTGNISSIMFINDNKEYEAEVSFIYRFTETQITLSTDTLTEIYSYHIVEDSLHLSNDDWGGSSLGFAKSN